MQCHVLGVTLLPVVGALLVADVRRRVTPGERRTLMRVGVGGAAIIALSFLPLVIHELTTDFAEVNAAMAYLRAGGDPSTVAPAARVLIVTGRVVSWPLVGLITSGASAALLAIVGVGALATWRFVTAVGPERVAVRWLALGLAWTAFALTLISPSLATVTEGLPNDHYHAFADPMVFVLLGIGAAALWHADDRTRAARSAVAPGRLLAGLGLLAVIAWAVQHQPPAIAPDGGFPAAEAAAARIEQTPALYDPIRIRSLPDFKTAEALTYPLIRDGRLVVTQGLGGEPTLAGSNLVVLCDSLFEAAIGQPCGGPAEDAVATAEGYGAVRDRFQAAPRQTISIYVAPQGLVSP
jgi:hypothetical protein